MSRNRSIRYGVDQDTGLVVSRVGNEVAWPVLDFEAIGQGGDGYAPGDFNGPTRYELHKFPAGQGDNRRVRWTRNVPFEAMTEHRAFWGFPPITYPGSES
jgi:hypothetical protein